MSEWLREVEQAGYSYSVQYTGPDLESSPLLPHNQHNNDRDNNRWIRYFWIVFLITLFLTGLGIGCYLIIEEDQTSVLSQPFVLINRAGWRAISVQTEIPQYPGLLSHVAITQTTTDNCDNLNDCSKIIRQIQIKHLARNLSDIAYNFILAGDGATYEARGWSFQPQMAGVVSNSTLVIGFLGDFEFISPANNQIEECRILLTEALNKKILDPCYKIILIKDKPQDDSNGLVHVYNKLKMENNNRKLNLNCSN